MVVYKFTFINEGTRECPSHWLSTQPHSHRCHCTQSFCVAADGEPLTLDTRAADKTDKNENCKFIKLSRFLYN